MSSDSNEVEGMIECPYCMCIFASDFDLNCHLKAFGSKRAEHLFLLDKAHKSVDSTYARGSLSKGSKKIFERKSQFYRQ